MGVRALVVEDHAMVGEMLAARLQDAGFGVVPVARSSREALVLARKYSVELVLCDINLGEGDSGIELTRQLTQKYPQLRVVMVSAENDGRLTQRAYDAGAVGFVSKLANGVELLDVVSEALDGVEGAADRHTYRSLIESLRQRRQSKDGVLTPREREVVQLMAQGITTTAALAKELVLSPHSVRSHVESCRRKLGVRTRAELVVKAYQLDLLG